MDKLVLRSGYSLKEEERRPPPIFDFEMGIDFDETTPEQLNEEAEKAHVLTRKVSEHQLETQSNCVTFSGVDRKDGFIKIPCNKRIPATEARGQQYHVAKGTRQIDITGCWKISPIISELSGSIFTDRELLMRGVKVNSTLEVKDRIATRIWFDADLINLTITHCENIRIEVEGDVKVGIECISSDNVYIGCESFYFIRADECTNLTVAGDAKRSSMLDLRKSTNVNVGGQCVTSNALTSLRYKMNDEGWYVRVLDDEDVFKFAGAKSLPDITLMKHHNTSRKGYYR